MSVYVNDPSRILLIASLTQYPFALSYATGHIPEKYVTSIISFFVSAFILQVTNGYMVAYGIAWNITQAWIGLLVLALLFFFIMSLLKFDINSFLFTTTALLLFAVLLGQEFSLHWLNTTTGMTWQLSTVVILIVISSLIIWYLCTMTRAGNIISAYLQPLMLCGAGMMSLDVLTTPGAWESLSESAYTLTFETLWLCVFAVVTAAPYAIIFVWSRRYWPVAKEQPSDPPAKRTHKVPRLTRPTPETDPLLALSHAKHKRLSWHPDHTDSLSFELPISEFPA